MEQKQETGLNRTFLKTNPNRAHIIKTGPRHHKFWPTVNTLLKTSTQNSAPLNHNNTTITDPQQKTTAFTQHFNDIFTDTNSSHFDSQFKQTLESSLPAFTPLTSVPDTPHTHELLTPITLQELTNTLNTTKNNKAPGPDTITYEHIKHFPLIALHLIHDLYNAMLQTAYIPLAFKTSTVNIIPKQNKDLSLITSYRPITLAPTLSKLYEKIINTRLIRYTLSKHILQPHQTAFIPHRDTTENILHALQLIIQQFNQNKYTLILSLDIKQAFDTTWNNAILHTLLQHTPHHFCIIIHSFLY